MAPKAKKSAGAAGSAAKAVAARRGAKSKAKVKSAAAPAAPTPQELAAVQLQRFSRGFLARRRVKEKRQQQRQLAEALRASELAALKAERRRAEQESAKQEQKRKLAQERLADTRAMLEAAFEGKEEMVLKFLEKGLPVDAAAQGITPLSEAAAAGKTELLQLLLDRKANPNSRGEFNRTPLWRAAYSNRSSILPLLLEAGADPRLRDEHGQGPGDVCNEDTWHIWDHRRCWDLDLERTDELLEDYDSYLSQLRIQELRRQSEEMHDVEEAYEVCLKKHQAAQMIFAKAKMQMRLREKEWGQKLAAGHKDALEACASADQALQQAEETAEEARRSFDQAALARLAAAEQCGVTLAVAGRDVPVRELNNVLLRDLGERIALSSRWPLVIDPENIAQKLIQYSGCSLLNFFYPSDMEAERLRLSLLSMLRAGGVLALDLLSFGAGVAMELLAAPFEELRPKLFADLCSRQLLKAPSSGRGMPAFYELTTKEERQDRFKAQVFEEKRLATFKFMILTTTELPHPELMEHFDLIRVVPNA